MNVSQRGAVPPFHVMRVMSAANARRARQLPVYEFFVGQPGTGAPAPVQAAARAALDSDRIGYTAALGIDELRTAIAGHYARAHGLVVDPAAVVVTTGSSGAFLLAFLAAFDAGDAVAVARPGYPAYRNMLSAMGCRVLEIPTGKSFLLTAADLEALPEVPAGVVVASPANPTGTMYTAAQLAELVQWCESHGTQLISDEIYHGITFGTPAISAWASGHDSVVVNSFSKYFSMTGWRLGWLLAPEQLIDPIDRLAGNFTLCPPTLSQHAAVAAFESYDELDATVAQYAENRQLMIEGLESIGITEMAPPDGAFYIYADVSRWTDDSLAWTARMLDECGVAVAPGIDFDPVDGGKHIRLSFCGDPVTIERGLPILGEWLASRG